VNVDISEQDLQAYVDGELAPGERARVEAAIAADPALARTVERERALRARLQAAFDPVLDEPVPARLRALLRDEASEAKPTGNVVDLATRRVRPTWHVPAYALAASLLVFAASLWLRPGIAPVRMQDDRLVASGPLARSLDRALASTPEPASSVAIGISFRAQDGRVCRSFAQGQALAGLACRSGDRWTIEVLSSPTEERQGDLRQAASETPPEVQAAIDARLQGEPFDAAQERAAREHGWR
jgi:anti-sigma factor RsiW